MRFVSKALFMNVKNKKFPNYKGILECPAAEAILLVANMRGVDLIIMGTRGLGRLTSALMGSQSQKVVGEASCSVLLIRK